MWRTSKPVSSGGASLLESSLCLRYLWLFSLFSSLRMFLKYVSLDHMWHYGIGLSEAGNDFFMFFPLISVLRGIAVVPVIRPFITLPAHHSAVWVNAICPDSHNYPKIESGKEISLTVVLWVRKSLGKYTKKDKESRHASWFSKTGNVSGLPNHFIHTPC